MRTKRISRLWERMTALYGSRWMLEYGNALRADGTLESVADMWADALEGLSNDKISAGIRACVDRDRQQPPTMPEFLRLCGYQSPSRVAYHQPFLPAQTRPPVDTPVMQCQRITDELRNQAAVELYPQLNGRTQEDRKLAVAAYWLGKIIAIPEVGPMVARQLQKAA